MPFQAPDSRGRESIIPLKECLEAVGGAEGAFYTAQKNEIKGTHTRTYTLSYAHGRETEQLLFIPKMWSDLWVGEGERLFTVWAPASHR